MSDKIHELYKLIKPIFTLVEQSKNEIEELSGEVEDDQDIPDVEWELINDITTSVQTFYSAFEEFEEQIGESK